jgi:hypothetical protein
MYVNYKEAAVYFRVCSAVPECVRPAHIRHTYGWAYSQTYRVSIYIGNSVTSSCLCLGLLYCKSFLKRLKATGLVSELKL